MWVCAVARAVRIEYGGAFYHVMARGNRRERIFRDEADRVLFSQTLGEACERTGWRVHAWVLMSNHYHLMVETPEGNLVAGMRWLQNTYTRRHNCRHRLWGRLFGDRYKAILSEGGSGYYYCSLMDYIHLNPVRAGLVRMKRGEKCAGLCLEQRGQGLCRAASSSTDLADGKRRVGHGAMCGHGGRSASFCRASGWPCAGARNSGGGDRARRRSAPQSSAAWMVLGQPSF